MPLLLLFELGGDSFDGLLDRDSTVHQAQILLVPVMPLALQSQILEGDPVVSDHQAAAGLGV